MLANSSAGPVPGPCATRVMVPSSIFQSTSASISRNSPAVFSAFIQLRISPKATGLRSILLLLWRKTFGGRSDFGDQIAHQRLVGQRRHLHLARLEPCRAGINSLAVEFHHAFLAGVGIDAGKADGKRGVLVDADPAQPIEHRLPTFERHRMDFPAAFGLSRPAPDLKGGGLAHRAATSRGAGLGRVSSTTVPARCADWLTCHSGSMPG